MDGLIVERTEHVARVTIDRSERRNALTRALLRGLADVAGELGADPSIRVVVFEGRGGDFSVGMDLKDPELANAMQAPLGERRRILKAGPRMVDAIQAMPQTTVAAMHGYCLGGGGCVALACDLRVAATDLRFGMPEALRGMNMSWHSVPLMVATFGPARTKELLLTQRYLSADEGQLWGLVNRVVAGGGDEARAEALRWAQEIAETVPPLAATMIKETVNATANALTPLVHMDTDQFLLTQMTDDFRESVSAFMEKRKPSFRGQ